MTLCLSIRNTVDAIMVRENALVALYYILNAFVDV